MQTKVQPFLLFRQFCNAVSAKELQYVEKYAAEKGLLTVPLVILLCFCNKTRSSTLGLVDMGSPADSVMLAHLFIRTAIRTEGSVNGSVLR